MLPPYGFCGLRVVDAIFINRTTLRTSAAVYTNVTATVVLKSNSVERQQGNRMAPLRRSPYDFVGTKDRIKTAGHLTATVRSPHGHCTVAVR